MRKRKRYTAEVKECSYWHVKGVHSKREQAERQLESIEERSQVFGGWDGYRILSFGLGSLTKLEREWNKQGERIV